MSNQVAKKLEAAKSIAPFLAEKERYQMAIDEINRLQALVDNSASTGHDSDHDHQIHTYEGAPWYADESDDSVRIFRGNMQIIKAPKRGTPYEEYWPTPEMIVWMLEVLNQAELQPTLDT